MKVYTHLLIVTLFLVDILEMSKWVTRLDPPRVDHLVSQPNPTHLLASQKKSNPTRPTTGWWVKRVGSQVQLIKKIHLLFFFSQN